MRRSCSACLRFLPGCGAVGHPQYGKDICVFDTSGCAKLAVGIKRLCKKLSLTPDQLEELSNHAGDVWQRIGGDILDASGIPCDSGKTISRKTVIEVVMDQMHSREDRLSPAVVAALDYSQPTYNSKAVRAAVARAFPYARWGW